MKLDGNLVFEDEQGTTILESKTSGRGEFAVLENHGALVVYDSKETELWYIGSRLSNKNKLYI